MHVVTNERGGKKPPYELYVSDGTVHPATTRNYHDITIDPGFPPSALFCLAIQDPDEESEEVFRKGNVIRVPNVRAKVYNGDLELAWSNLVLADQMDQGWTSKRCTVINPDDHRVMVINT